MSRKPPRQAPTPQPKPMKSQPPKPAMSKDKRVALPAVTSLADSTAETPIGGRDMVGGRKKRPAGAKAGPRTKHKPGPRRRTRG